MYVPGEPLPPPQFELTGAEAIMKFVYADGRCPEIELMVETWAGSDQVRFMGSLSTRVYPYEGGQGQVHKSLFARTPGLILAAFVDSNLPEPVLSGALRRVGNESMPQELTTASARELQQAVVRRAGESLRQHPEADALAKAIGRYYGTIYRNSGVGLSAMCGMGYVLGLLDLSWEGARTEILAQAAHEEAETVDWHAIEESLSPDQQSKGQVSHAEEELDQPE